METDAAIVEDLPGRVRLYCGDCLDILASLPENSIDSCVVDPPYHLQSVVKRFGSPTAAPAKIGKTGAYARASAGFMGRIWDGGDVAFRPETWALVLRVLKPGAHLVTFGGTRTYHRLACAIEDAGFEIRDSLMWIFGTGFPKSHDVSKGIDKAADYTLQSAFRRSAVAAVINAGMQLPRRSVDNWTKEDHAPGDKWWVEFCAWLPSLSDEQRTEIKRQVIGIGRSGNNALMGGLLGLFDRGEYDITAPATQAAQQWEGWGTALKPAFEPIILARKPLSEKTVAANVLRWRTGAINIDGSRIHSDDAKSYEYTVKRTMPGAGQNKTGERKQQDVLFTGHTKDGRWPANIIHDGSAEVIGLFPTVGDSHPPSNEGTLRTTNIIYGEDRQRSFHAGFTDTGSAARFFYRAKKDVLCDLCGLPYDAEWNVSTAELHSSTGSTQNESSALCGAAGLQLRDGGDNQSLRHSDANNAETHLQECLPLNDASVLSHAHLWPLEKIVQNVKSAASLCDLCATDIAQSLAALRRGQPQELLHTLVSISGHKKQILIDSLALYVEGRVSTDIILTIPSLKILLGSVLYAIDESIRPENQNAPSGLKRFHYDSKADAEDRIGSKHPTVKPVDLIRYLVRLVTPPGGVVLDCFAGTGTAGEAAFLEGMSSVLIEREADYQEDIRRRMRLVIAGPEERARERVKAKGKVEAPGPLFE